MSRRKTDARVVSPRLAKAYETCFRRGWTLEFVFEGLPHVEVLDVDEILARIYVREEWETVGEFLWRICDKIEALEREVKR